MSYQRKSIPLSKIFLDSENSRHGALETQEEIFGWMTSGKVRQKVLRLASEIARMGISPIEIPALVPMVLNGKSRYVVVEGNRRIAALKLLQNPKRCPDEKVRKQYAKLKAEAQVDIPGSLECVVFPALSETEYWIELRHGGEREGAGTVNWGPKEFDSFARRMGRYSANSSSVTLLEYALSEGLIDEEIYDAIPITNLTRVLSTTDVRDLMGAHVSKGEIFRVSSKPYFDRAVTDVLTALAQDGVTVKNLKEKDQRVAFVNKIKIKEEWGSYTLEPKTSLSEPAGLDGAEDTGNADLKDNTSPNGARGGTRLSTERKRVVSPSMNLKIENLRLRDIFTELKRLDAKFVNSGAVLTRVFLEGCTDIYLEKHAIAYSFNDKLTAKATKVRQHILDNNKGSKSVKGDLKGYEMLSGNPSSIGSSDTLNCSVHNMSFSLTSSDLKLLWNNLQSGMKWFEGSI